MKLPPLTCLMLFIASSTMAAPVKDAWTDEQVKTLCHSRAEKSANPGANFERCMNNKTRLIGKEKQPGEAVELNKADQRIEEKAKARKAATQK